MHKITHLINQKILYVALLLQRYWTPFTLAFVAKWVLLVPMKFMKRVRTFHLSVFLRNLKDYFPGLHKFQLHGVWENWVGAGRMKRKPFKMP